MGRRRGGSFRALYVARQRGSSGKGGGSWGPGGRQEEEDSNDGGRGGRSAEVDMEMGEGFAPRGSLFGSKREQARREANGEGSQ